MLPASSSKAAMLPGRVLAQHHAVHTLIKDRVENPEVTAFRWLDIACGQGQILANVERVLSTECCKKIKYVGFDVMLPYCRRAEELAVSLFGADSCVFVSEMDKFDSHLGDECFDAVTMTNTVHEITPDQLATTFVSALNRVSEAGFLYMYDMESLASPELGAIPWRGEEIELVFSRMMSAVGEAFRPTVSLYPHKTCTGWYLQLNRGYLSLSADALAGRRVEMERVAAATIRELLAKRLLDIHQMLSTVCRVGIDEGAESVAIINGLYDFWAISRALGGPVGLTSGEL